MAIRNTAPGLGKILTVALVVAFSVISLAMAYHAVQNSTEDRSKAAEEQTVFKQWNFNGSDAEGWGPIAPHKVTVTGGNLILATQKSSNAPGFRNRDVSTVMPKGLKSVMLSIFVGDSSRVTPTPAKCPTPPPTCKHPVLVGDPHGSRGCPLYRCIESTFQKNPTAKPNSEGWSGTYDQVRGVSDETDETAIAQSVKAHVMCTEDARLCSDGSYVARSGPNCEFAACPGTPAVLPSIKKFTGVLHYKLVGKSQFEKSVDFSGTANGQFQTVRITLPDIGEVSLERLRVVFTSGIKPGDKVLIDWIRLVGSLTRPSYTPTPVSCQGTLTGYTPTESCGTDTYRYVSYTCSDGYTGKQGGTTSCKSTALWKQYASDDCHRRTDPHCSVTPTHSTSTPTYPSVDPTRYEHPPTPTPLSGYSCPAGEWINCMPGPVNGGGMGGVSHTNCSGEYISWAKAHCPNFKGAAY